VIGNACFYRGDIFGFCDSRIKERILNGQTLADS